LLNSYLVTGGAGFVGSNLVEALLAGADGPARVRVLDNFSTGKAENLAGLTGSLEVVEGDITDLSTVQAAMRGIDYVFHQAAIPSVQRSVGDPFATDRANVLGTLNVLWAAREAAVKRVVYAGSSSAYGEASAPAKYEALPTMPLSPYGVSKLTGELYCAAFTRVYGLETVTLRYFNVFGPRQDPGSEYSAVIPRFIQALLTGQQPIVYGDGEQTRDFTYVANVVQGNLLALRAPEAAGDVFNVAMGGQVSLNTLARLVGEVLGVAVNPTYAGARAGDIRDSRADISKARAVLGYAPRVDFRTGLELTVAWLRQAQSAAV
jgi:nucleoside-diphosphate-sugar epimerase